MPASDLGSNARRWLSPGPASPWRFDDAGDALVWRDGETVAFRPEIVEALRRVARGLDVVPQFPAVAVLLAAARADGRKLSSERWDLVRDAMETATPWLFARVAAVKEVAETASALRMLEFVPDEVFSRRDALPFLVEAVFEGAGLPRDPKGAAEFLRDLDAEPTPGTAQPTEEESRRQAAEWGEGLAALRLGLGRLDPATLARRALTGLDRDVLPAELAWPDAIRVRGMLAALRGDPELGAIARLATDVMAAVRLPRPGATPEDLPIGGYADLANRGSPERLLVSELAHDGLTLAVRVALHEALYLRREAPPRAPHGARCILLDAGIRLWGVGRVFATSVGLALAASTERAVSVRAWRADGRRIERVDLGSRAGIDAHLEALQPEPHPAAALRPFLAECASQSGGVECCVVTHANALEEPEVRDALRAAGRVVYVVGIAGTGDLTVHAFNAAGSQVIRTAKLDLAALLAAEPKAHGRLSPLGLRDPARDDASLPAILRLDRLPLRIPHPLHEAGFRDAQGHGMVARTPDRRLVLWTDPALGPIELADHTPPGALRDFRVTDFVVHLVVTGGRGIPSAWMRVDLTESIVSTVQLPSIGRTPSAAVVIGEFGEMVGLISGRRVHVIHGDDPSRVAEVIDLPGGAVQFDGRLFRRSSTGEWWLLVNVGESARLEPLPTDHRREVVMMFERSGRDGPWALLKSPARLMSVANGHVTPLTLPPTFDGVQPLVSSSGRRLLFRSRVGGPCAVADLEEGSIREVGPISDLTSALEPTVPSLQVPNVRHRARRESSVGRTDDEGLVVDGRVLQLSGKGGLQFESAAHERIEKLRPFTWARQGLPGCRWHLFTARWDDGSRALVDSRGMLHLVSSDRSIPEITLVHRDGETAGWSSDGVMHGSRYFLGDTPSVPADEFLRRVHRFVQRLR